MREGVAMKKEELRKLILTAKGAVEADVVIKNCKVVNVFTGEIQEGDIAISGDQIAGVGQYQGKVEVDAGGRTGQTAGASWRLYHHRRSS